MQSRKVDIIGNIERVSFPDFQLIDVPAKIDTGADSSAIWASNIRLEDEKLLFNFFAPGSMFHANEVVISTVYKVTMIKNSFGVKEFRYKVRLKVKLGNHTLTRWFTLADRSNNAYPILLGKNFLKNKFVVDVAHKHMHSQEISNHKVLVFTKDQKESSEFFEKVKSKNDILIDYFCADYEVLLFCINGTDIKVQNVSDNLVDVADYDFIFFKNHHDSEFSYAVAEYLQFRGRSFVDRESVKYMSSSKLSEYMKLACHGLPVPLTVCAKSNILRGQFDNLDKLLGLPFVLKAIDSNNGKDNYLISKEEEFDKIMSNNSEGLIYLAQKYIPNNGFYRLYVFGKEVSLGIWRASVPHRDKLKAHLNKPSGGINATNIPIDSISGEARDLALRASICMDRQISGVDLIQDKITKKWYILEVNNGPQIRSGSFKSEKVDAIANFFNKELSR